MEISRNAFAHNRLLTLIANGAYSRAAAPNTHRLIYTGIIRPAALFAIEACSLINDDYQLTPPHLTSQSPRLCPQPIPHRRHSRVQPNLWSPPEQRIHPYPTIKMVDSPLLRPRRRKQPTSKPTTPPR